MIGQMAVVRRGYGTGAAGQGPFLEGPPPPLSSSLSAAARRRRHTIRHKRWTTKGFRFKSYYLPMLKYYYYLFLIINNNFFSFLTFF